MFKFRNVISIVSVIVIVTLVGGCSMWGHKDEPSWTQDEGIAYLNTRYGVEFEFLGGSGGGLFGGSPQGFWARTPSLTNPQTRISALAQNATDEKTTFIDDFLYYKFAEEAQQFGQPVVDSIFPDYVLTTQVDYPVHYPDTFDGLTSDKEFFDWLTDQAQNSEYYSDRPLTTLTILTKDRGDNLDDVAAKLVPLLSESTGWGLDGSLNVPCHLVIKAYSPDVFQQWAAYYSRPRIGMPGGDDNWKPGGPASDPLHETSVRF